MKKYTPSYVSRTFNGGAAAQTPNPFPGRNPLRIYWWGLGGSTHVGKFTSAVWKQYLALKDRHKCFVIFDKGGRVLSGSNNSTASLNPCRLEVFRRYFARPDMARTGFHKTLSGLEVHKVGKLFTFVYPDDLVRGGQYEPFSLTTWLKNVYHDFPTAPKTKPAPRNV